VKASVGVSTEYHGTSVICGAVVGVGGQVVKKLVHSNFGGFGGGGLLGTQGAESGKEVVVDCTCIVEESADDALNSLDTFCGERRVVGFNMGELGGFLAKNNFSMLVMRELALGRHGMLVPGADIIDITQHGFAT
jgi:hypothetical protein